jgi:hypothetical protein
VAGRARAVCRTPEERGLPGHFAAKW